MSRRPSDINRIADAKDQHGLTSDAAVRRGLIEGRRVVIAFLRQRVGVEDAEEVFQRFAVRALENADDLRDIRSLHVWLSRLLHSSLVDYLRQRGRRDQREQYVSEVELERLGGVTDPGTAEVVCACLYKILPTLPPSYVEVIWRIDLLGEPRDRTAASLRTTMSNVGVRLYRGRVMLRRRLEEMCLTCPVHGFLNCECEEAERVRRLHEAKRHAHRSQRAASLRRTGSAPGS